jgi:hypothetical protein
MNPTTMGERSLDMLILNELEIGRYSVSGPPSRADLSIRVQLIAGVTGDN